MRKLAPIILILSIALSGCGQTTAVEETGELSDAAYEESEQAIDSAGEEVGEAGEAVDGATEGAISCPNDPRCGE
jgi:hypothetical protein